MLEIGNGRETANGWGAVQRGTAMGVLWTDIVTMCLEHLAARLQCVIQNWYKSAYQFQARVVQDLASRARRADRLARGHCVLYMHHLYPGGSRSLAKAWNAPTQMTVDRAGVM